MKARSLFLMSALALFAAACSSNNNKSNATQIAATAPPSAVATQATRATAAATTAGTPGASVAVLPNGTATAAAVVVPDDLIKAAQKEGQVQVYTSWSPASSDRLTAAFKKRYNVDLKVFQAPPSQTQPRFEAESKSGNGIADMLAHSDPISFDDFASKGFIKSFLKSDIPGIDAYPQPFNGLYVPISIAPYGIAYNNKVISAQDSPKSMKDLLDPKYKDQMVGVDPRAGLLSVAWMDFLAQQNGGNDFLKKLFADQNVRWVDSAPAAVEQVSSGERKIALFATSTFVRGAQISGAPLGFNVLDPAYSPTLSIALARVAPHPNAARLFLSFLLTAEGQQALNGDKLAVATIPNVPETLPQPKTIVLPVTADLQKVAARQNEILAAAGIH